ncbi:hypothetical protein HK101_004775 [Irineochytrium annulatum]|nr:hypothetical protein HK101_004775 [Irineochytrium annulatum]
MRLPATPVPEWLSATSQAIYSGLLYMLSSGLFGRNARQLQRQLRNVVGFLSVALGIFVIVTYMSDGDATVRSDSSLWRWMGWDTGRAPRPAGRKAKPSLTKAELFRRIAKNEHVLIYVQQPLKDHDNIFAHPYHLLYLSRRCVVPCSFLSHDARSHRPFTQAGLDHLWLSGSEAAKLSRSAQAQLHSDRIPDSLPPHSFLSTILRRKSLQAVILSHSEFEPKFYPHTGNESYFDPRVDVPVDFGAGYSPPVAPSPKSSSTTAALSYRVPDIVVGHVRAADVRVNYVNHHYSSFRDFITEVRFQHSSEGLGGRQWGRRWHGLVVFTPPCERMAPGVINYLVRLRGIMLVHVYGGCLADRELEGGQTLNENRRMRIAGQYLFFMVIEDGLVASGAGVGSLTTGSGGKARGSGHVTSQFWKGLSYNSVLVAWGGTDIDTFVPTNMSVILVRDYDADPALLRDRLEQSREEMEWYKMMKWKEDRSGDIRREFREVWGWSQERAVCGLCENVAAKVLGRNLRPAFDSQEQWYKDTDRVLEAHFNEGVIVYSASNSSSKSAAG